MLSFSFADALAVSEAGTTFPTLEFGTVLGWISPCLTTLQLAPLLVVAEIQGIIPPIDVRGEEVGRRGTTIVVLVIS